MLYFSIQNARGGREKQPRLRGGLRSDGFILGSFSDPARILLGTCSDRPRIGNDVSAVFEKFLRNFGESFCVAGAVFGEFGQ